MRIIPPFTKELKLSVSILENFSSPFRPFVTVSKTHTNIGNRKLQTLMVTAPIEAEDEMDHVSYFPQVHFGSNPTQSPPTRKDILFLRKYIFN